MHVEHTADAIIALINSKPRSPTKGEIAAIFEDIEKRAAYHKPLEPENRPGLKDWSQKSARSMHVG